MSQTQTGYTNGKRQDEARMRRAIKETREYLELNSNPDATDDDAFEHLMGDCGKGAHGGCSMAGTEYCDWECPFS